MIEVYKLVLSDELLVLFERFKASGLTSSVDKKLLIRLLSRIKLNYLTNIQQIQRCQDNLPTEFVADVVPALLAQNVKGESLESLALKTVHRVILTEEQKNLPYVNINCAKFDTNFSITCKKNSSRSELISHLKMLIGGAQRVHIIDKYLHNALKNGRCLLEQLIPGNDVEICCHDTKSCRKRKKGAAREYRPAYTQTVNRLRQFGLKNSVVFKLQNYKRIHDRYLIIEYGTHTYQVIFSSGFEYIFNDKKEITCVFMET